MKIRIVKEQSLILISSANLSALEIFMLIIGWMRDILLAKRSYFVLVRRCFVYSNSRKEM